MNNRWAGYLGAVLVTASVVYIVVILWENLGALRDWRPSAVSVAALVTATSLYASSSLLLSETWTTIISTLTDGLRNRARWRLIYARSQLAKYLPGNVFHIAGRHALGRELGISHAALGMATLFEFGGLVASAITCALITWLFFGVGRYFVDSKIAVVVLASLPVLLYAGVRRIEPWVISKIGARSLGERSGLSKTAMKILLSYVCFFLIGGFCLTVLAASFDVETVLANGGRTILTFAIGWVAGFVTPGAPSGIGVREAVIISALDGVLPAADAVLVAFLLRFATILGDVLFFVAVKLS